MRKCTYICYSIRGDGYMGRARIFNPNLYFASFEALESDLKRRFKCADVLINDYMTPVAILYLAWAGFDKAGIAKIKKQYLAPIGNVIYDELSNSNMAIPESAMEFLKRYSEHPIFMSHSNISPYLVRKRQSIQVDDRSIVNSIAHLNAVLKSTDPHYSFMAVAESGSFYRAYQMQKSGVEFPVYRRHKRLTELGIQKYEMIFGRKFNNVATLSRYINLYESFIEYYYNE